MENKILHFLFEIPDTHEFIMHKYFMNYEIKNLGLRVFLTVFLQNKKITW